MTMKEMLIKLVLMLSIALMTIPSGAQVTVEIKNKPLTEALKQLEEQSGYSFFYSSALPDRDALVSVKAENKGIVYVMNHLLAGLNISYEVLDDHQITLYEKDDEDKKKPQKSSGIISGVVLDPDNLPVIGAGVMIAGTSKGTVADENGRWTLEIEDDDTILEVSSMGFDSRMVDVAGRTELTVVLRPDTQFLEEVVVVGYGTQKKSQSYRFRVDGGK